MTPQVLPSAITHNYSQVKNVRILNFRDDADSDVTILLGYLLDPANGSPGGLLLLSYPLIKFAALNWQGEERPEKQSF